MLDLVEFVFQLLSWIRKVGEETLSSHTLLLRTATDSTGVKTIEKTFENFYFNALVGNHSKTCFLFFNNVFVAASNR